MESIITYKRQLNTLNWIPFVKSKLDLKCLVESNLKCLVVFSMFILIPIVKSKLDFIIVVFYMFIYI